MNIPLVNHRPRGAARLRLPLLLSAIFALAAFLPAGRLDAKVESYLDKPDDWYATAEARQIIANVLSYQSAWGGWPKNTDTADNPYAGDPQELHPTFDNSATMDELRFLARVIRTTQDARCRAAFDRGLDYVLLAQYPTGGWPQSYPPDDYYHRYITFNDNAMVRILEFLREVSRTEAFSFVSPERRAAAQDSFERGIDCILKCQIKVDGKLTAWCAQHDEEDYSPRPARSFELTSLSGSESVGIVKLLMSLERPTPQVVQAVDAAVDWMKQVPLHGIKIVKERDPNFNNKNDKHVVADPAAPDLWARFYEIGTNKPIYSDRDGVAKSDLKDIGYERRNGYGWTGTWPQSVIGKLDKWKAALAKKGLPGAASAAAPAWTPKAKIALGGDTSVTDHEGWAFGLKKKLAPGVLCLDLSGAALKRVDPPGDGTISDVAMFHDVPSPAAPLPAKERLVYLSEAWWKKAIAAKPDYLLLQFDGRETAVDNNGSENPPDALARKIAAAVAQAKAAGIKPVLVTALPVWRRNAEGKLTPDPTTAPATVRQAAAEQKIPLIDLHAQGLASAESQGAEGMGRMWHAAMRPEEAPAQPAAAVPPSSPTAASPPTATTTPLTPTATAATVPPVRQAPAHLTPEGSEFYGIWAAENLARENAMPKAWFR